MFFFLMIRRPPRSTLFPYTTLFRSQSVWRNYPFSLGIASGDPTPDGFVIWTRLAPEPLERDGGMGIGVAPVKWEDRKSTRLNSSHANISYAVFCLKKKKITSYISYT